MIPFIIILNPVFDFLAEPFQAGYEFRAIVSQGLTISAYDRPINDLKEGLHPRVSELMKGAFNNRTPKPTYTFTWDVQRVPYFL